MSNVNLNGQDPLKNKMLYLQNVKSYVNNFSNLSDELKNDKEVVLESVKLNGMILKYVTNTFKEDTEVVLTAVKENYNSYEFASDELKRDKSIALAAVTQDGLFLKYVIQYVHNIDVNQAAIKQNSGAQQIVLDKIFPPESKEGLRPPIPFNF